MYGFKQNMLQYYDQMYIKKNIQKDNHILLNYIYNKNINDLYNEIFTFNNENQGNM